MKVDIWSDVICPWCYVGKRRLEAAIAQFAHGSEIELEWHSFELDPTSAPEHRGDNASRLARKYGMSVEQAQASIDNLTRIGAEEGLKFRFDRARSGNTFDAHRLIHLAHDRGLQDQVKERLMQAYFTDGELISDHETLIRVVSEVGIEAAEIRLALDSDKYGDAVRADEEAATELGISGVPFFVIDGKFAISGAQPVETMVSVLDRAWAKAHSVEGVGDAGNTCDAGSCTT